MKVRIEEAEKRRQKRLNDETADSKRKKQKEEKFSKNANRNEKENMRFLKKRFRKLIQAVELLRTKIYPNAAIEIGFKNLRGNISVNVATRGAAKRGDLGLRITMIIDAGEFEESTYFESMAQEHYSFTKTLRSPHSIVLEVNDSQKISFEEQRGESKLIQTPGQMKSGGGSYITYPEGEKLENVNLDTMLNFIADLIVNRR